MIVQYSRYLMPYGWITTAFLYLKDWIVHSEYVSWYQSSFYPVNNLDFFLFPTWSGAILAIGRGGRKTTLWLVKKRTFWQKIVISCLQINLAWWIKRSSEQNTAHKAFWRGFRTPRWWKLRKMGSKTWRGVTLSGITPTLRPISRMAPAC